MTYIIFIILVGEYVTKRMGQQSQNHKGLGFNSHCQSRVQVLNKLLLLSCLPLPEPTQ